jgi:hypothetical protein
VRARWYVDADTLGLGHILARARPDVTYCGDSGKRKKSRLYLPPCIIQDTEDDDDKWIPAVTEEGLAIITRDKRIQTRTNEKNTVLASGARVFAVTSKAQLDNWGLLEIVVTRWRDLELAAEEPGPYIYAVTRTAISKIVL